MSAGSEISCLYRQKTVGSRIGEGASLLDEAVGQKQFSESNSREASYILPGEIFTTGNCL